MKTPFPIAALGLVVVLIAGAAVISYSNVPTSGLVAATGVLPGIPNTPNTGGAEVPDEGHYITVTDSCGPHFEGACVAIRAGPGETFDKVGAVRTGQVLEVATPTITDGTGRVWYKIIFNEWVRYPERVIGDWYVAAAFVTPFTHDPGRDYDPAHDAPTTKRIVVDRSEQMLYAYDGDTLFMEHAVSTGLDDTPTPLGTFVVYRKTPSRYMQGPLPGISDQYYDLPGVSWNLYFTAEGGTIHGAYWHNEFGHPWSHGCVNLPVDVAHTLYEWAPLGTSVTVEE